MLLLCLLLPPADDAADLARQAHAALRQNQPDAALKLAERAVAADAKSPAAHVARGSAQFYLGKAAESVADFEKAAELQPRLKPELWQLGISYYYVGRYADGAKLFTLHKTANPDDVENAAWHFLCTARADGLDKAKANLMPIQVERDRRVPMAQVYDLFAGKCEPAAVFAAAEKGAADTEEGQRQRFYAHLYVGLFHEARGESAKAKEQIDRAAELGRASGDYMSATARVHASNLKK